MTECRPQRSGSTYACGDELAFSFRVVDGSHYTDLDNTTRGTYEIRGDKVHFHSAHLDGLVDSRAGRGGCGA